MYGYIYKTTNLINGLIYIGQHKATKFEPTRYIGSGNNIKAAIREFGKENFTCELLAIAETLEELNSLEEYWVDFYNSRDPRIGYNVKKGGEQLGLTGCCKIRREEETLIVERASVETYLAEGWALTNTEETRKEKSKGYQKRYYEKNKEKLLARGKIWREDNKDKMRELKIEWTKNHPEECKQRKKRFYQNNREKAKASMKKYYEKNKEQIQAQRKQSNPTYTKNYYEKNKEKILEKAKQRYQKKKEAKNKDSNEN